MKLKEPIEVVTTNYDLVIEESIQLSNAPIRTGRNLTNQPTLDPSLWDITNLSTSSPSAFGLLTKLHGSVDWARGPNQIYVGTPMFHGQHDRHAIIYPGFKGEPNDDLFLRLNLYFRHILSKADIAVFIGYAFRDDYINAI